MLWRMKLPVDGNPEAVPALTGSDMLNIQGQTTALAHTQRVIGSGRLASTWIFAGPTGVGKFQTAVEMAKTSLCDQPIHRPNLHDGQLFNALLEPDFVLTLPCGQCDSCKAVEFRNHPDLHIVSRELIRYHDRSGKSKGTTLSIQVIRGEIIGDDSPEHRVEPKIYKRSQRGRGKWFIIDDADLMEIPAQNALLKTLEEPPPQNYIILITTSPTELLSTIRSRSQFVQFRDLSFAVMVPELIKRGADTAQAQLLARLSGGSLGRAIIFQQAAIAADRAETTRTAAKNAAADQPAFPHWINSISSVLDNMLAGRDGGMALADVIQKCAEQYAKAMLKRDPLASKDRAVRDGVGLMFSFAAAWLDDRLRHATGAEIIAPLPSHAHAMEPGAALECIAVCRQAEVQADMNAHIGVLVAATCTGMEHAMRKVQFVQ
jgi:DNA polymerase-3 subunit delta'